jgi:hypothetical protein
MEKKKRAHNLKKLIKSGSRKAISVAANKWMNKQLVDKIITVTLMNVSKS